MLALVAAPVVLVACEALKKEDGAEVAADIWAAFLACSSAGTFEAQVNDILVDRCYSCHQTESGFLLHNENAGFNYAMSLNQLLDNDFFNPTINPLLVKATGGDSHVGGTILSQIDDDYGYIVEWIYEERANPCGMSIGDGGE